MSGSGAGAAGKPAEGGLAVTLPHTRPSWGLGVLPIPGLGAGLLWVPEHGGGASSGFHQRVWGREELS